jgi:hypothetical protein
MKMNKKEKQHAPTHQNRNCIVSTLFQRQAYPNIGIHIFLRFYMRQSFNDTYRRQHYTKPVNATCSDISQHRQLATLLQKQKQTKALHFIVALTNQKMVNDSHFLKM